MKAQDCLDILREIKDVAFATVDEKGKPQVRIIDVMIVEDEKLYFCTGRGKDFHKQLITKGDVAITGLNKNFQMIRLEGEAKKVEDNKYWIDRIFDENPAMNSVYPENSRYILDAFYIDNGLIEFFDLGKNPINRYSFSIGEDTVKGKGFIITSTCIGCGKCLHGCPQKCITKGEPYVINQDHCLHCGLCFENCPVSAIERRG